jgi:hypothetical protein
MSNKLFASVLIYSAKSLNREINNSNFSEILCSEGSLFVKEILKNRFWKYVSARLKKTE